ncbi:hypothetical protein [Janthinobacterium sp. YR213]|uniref:hypothetical protein n=1 Tax=Janthinobacterium sp. YR213 TaxID=1881027 RepID=UPI0008845946|nr:hypothetical protein [Janthinobacterium sp. YR213]SDH45903.1 hypothetical protein SAMN05428968_3520 [Janthinobacterium sp. YR213]
MTFELILGQLSSARDPVAMVAALRATAIPRSTDAQQAAIDALRAAIGRGRTGRALSAARSFLVLLEPHKAIARLKREGILRASTFDFDARTVRHVVADWIENAIPYGLSVIDVRYLRSTATMFDLASSLRTLFQQIVTQLELGGELVINNLLCEVDAGMCYPDRLSLGGNDEREITHEELAEAFSYLLTVYQRRKLGTMAVLGLPSHDAGYSMQYRSLLDDALKICRYLEVEVQIESFPFHAVRQGNSIRIESIDPTLERSIRIGYFQKEMRQYFDHYRLTNSHAENKILSVSAFAEQFFSVHGNTLVQLKQLPIPRFRSELPMYPELVEMFSDDRAFLEDILIFESLAWEEYIDPKEVSYAIVDGSVTVFDLIKVQRFFKFMHLGLRNAVARHVPYFEQTGLYMTSCLPTFSHASLINILALTVGNSKASAVLTMLTANLAAPNLDIYYTPIIKVRDCYMVPLGIMSNVNLARNLLCKLHNRMVPVGPDRIDRMQSELALALRKAGFRVAEEINLTIGRNKLEVDLLAWKDEHVFIFECKNTYHPCNIYELRTSYNAMAGASNQLTLRKDWLIDPANQQCLFTRLGWKIPPSLTVYTCIALGNRVFNGYQFEGLHPVRQVHEICGLLSHGYVETHDGLRLRLWAHDVFTVGDLIAHLEGSGLLADMHAAVLPLEVATQVGEMSLIQSTFAIDLYQLHGAILDRWPRMPTA